MFKKFNTACFVNSNKLTTEEFQSLLKDSRVQVFEERGLNAFKGKIQSLIQKGMDDSLTEDEVEIIEKAQKDLSKLTKKVIIDKRGHRKTVYIKVGEDETEEH